MFNSFLSQKCYVIKVVSSCQKTFNFFAWLFSFIWPDLIHLATKYRRPYREIAPIGLPINISFLIEGCELVIGGYQYDMRQDLTLKGASTFVNNTRNNLAIYSLCSHITSLFHT